MNIVNTIKKRPLLISFLLVALIVLHGLFDEAFKVDNTTILLVLLVILLPYIPLLSKIKFGDFESEIGHKEVERLGEKVQDIQTSPEGSVPGKKVQELEELAESDPTLALAKARIEIEKRLRSLEDIHLSEPRSKSMHRGLRQIVYDLQKQQVLDPSLASILHDIIAVANQAVHGATIERHNAIKLAQYASRVLMELDTIVVERALHAESEATTPQKVDSYREAEYILETIVPLVDKPEKKTYRLNQEQLDAFFEGYNEYAEFIVSLKKANRK
jgi:hypothetical protein